MIQLEGITKSFGALQVLKGIDLEIGKGEVVSIVGPSGAGKTTLLQIMGTLDKPDGGRIILNGTEVNRLKEKELSAFRNREIGFVFQFHQLLPEFTAVENVMMPSLIQGKSSGTARKEALDLLDFLGFTSFDFMSMLGEIEDEFDVEVEQSEVVNIRTVQEAVDYLEKLTSES